MPAPSTHKSVCSDNREISDTVEISGEVCLRMVEEYPLEKGATHRPVHQSPRRDFALWFRLRELDEAEAARPFAFQVAVKPGPLAHRADKEHAERSDVQRHAACEIPCSSLWSWRNKMAVAGCCNWQPAPRTWLLYQIRLPSYRNPLSGSAQRVVQLVCTLFTSSRTVTCLHWSTRAVARRWCVAGAEGCKGLCCEMTLCRPSMAPPSELPSVSEE